MKQPPLPDRPHRSSTVHPEQRSTLAVIALVLALVPCCPMVSLLGAVLGMVALRRIQTSQGRLGGQRLAVAATFIGIGISLLSTLALSIANHQIQQGSTRAMVEQVEGFIRDAAEQRPQQAQRRLAASLHGDESIHQIEWFGQEVASRYGRLQRVSIASQSRSGPAFRPRIDLAVVFVFDRQKSTGAVVFEVRPGTTSLMPAMLLESIYIEDREHGDLAFPPPQDTAAAISPPG